MKKPFAKLYSSVGHSCATTAITVTSKGVVPGKFRSLGGLLTIDRCYALSQTPKAFAGRL